MSLRSTSKRAIALALLISSTVGQSLAMTADQPLRGSRDGRLIVASNPTQTADNTNPITYSLQVIVKDDNGQRVPGLVVDFYALDNVQSQNIPGTDPGSGYPEPKLETATKRHLDVVKTAVDGSATLILSESQVPFEGRNPGAIGPKINLLDNAEIYYEFQPALMDTNVTSSSPAVMGRAGPTRFKSSRVFSRPNLDYALNNVVDPEAWGLFIADYGFESRHIKAVHSLAEEHDHDADLDNVINGLSSRGEDAAVQRLLELTGRAGSNSGTTVTAVGSGQAPGIHKRMDSDHDTITTTSGSTPYYPPCATRRYSNDVYGYARYDSNHNWLSDLSDPGASSVIVTYQYRGAPGYSDFRESCRTTGSGSYVFDTPPPGSTQHRMTFQVASPRGILQALGVMPSSGGLVGSVNLPIVGGMGYRQDVLLSTQESGTGNSIDTAKPMQEDVVTQLPEEDWFQILLAEFHLIPEIQGRVTLAEATQISIDFKRGAGIGLDAGVVGVAVGFKINAGAKAEKGTSEASAWLTDPSSVFVELPMTRKCPIEGQAMSCTKWRVGDVAEAEDGELTRISRLKEYNGTMSPMPPGNGNDLVELYTNPNPTVRGYGKQMDSNWARGVFIGGEWYRSGKVGLDELGLPGASLNGESSEAIKWEHTEKCTYSYRHDIPLVSYSEALMYRVNGYEPHGLIWMQRAGMDLPYLRGDSGDGRYCQLPTKHFLVEPPVLVPAASAKLRMWLYRTTWVERTDAGVKVLRGGGSGCEMTPLSSSPSIWDIYGNNRMLHFKVEDQYGQNQPTVFRSEQSFEHDVNRYHGAGDPPNSSSYGSFAAYPNGWQFLAPDSYFPGTFMFEIFRVRPYHTSVSNFGASMAVGQPGAFDPKQEAEGPDGTLGLKADCSFAFTGGSDHSVTLNDPEKYLNVITWCDAKHLWQPDTPETAAAFLTSIRGWGSKYIDLWCQHANTPGCPQ